MATTIKTSSKNYITKIQKYLRSTCGRLQGKNNKRILWLSLRNMNDDQSK